MRSNESWPEVFGFKIGGKCPVVIISVQENSVAHQAGLQPGDQILELNGENVQGLTKEQITLLAKRSTRVPPAIAVISRIRTLDLRRRRGRFGFTVRGNGPVYVYDVEDRGPAYNTGIRQGDLILKVNGMNVRHANADQVQQIVEACGPTITLVLIAGSQSIDDGEQPSTSSRYRRARDFYLQMNYFLPRDNYKKSQLIKALNQYARDRSINQLAKNLLDVLQAPVERKLLREIRCLIPKKHKPEYDIMVGINSKSSVHQRPHSTLYFNSLSKSMDELDMKRTWSSGSSMDINKRNIQAHPPRIVRVKRGPGSGFGFTLSGDTPIFVKSLDIGGPADTAKLKPGDHILEINGLNVRGKRHHAVVELLKGSGTYPSLLVQWRPMSVMKCEASTSTLGSKSGLSVTFDKINEDAGIHRSASVASRASTRTEQLIMNRFPGSDPQSVHTLAREFKIQMSRLFTSGEQKYLKQCLIDYKLERNISKLLDAIEPVLDDSEKLCILHYISELLPGVEQADFDKGAAKIFAKQSQDGKVPSFSAADNDIMDILYRVQGMRLSDQPRERSLIGGTATSLDRPDQWPGKGAVSQWNSFARQDLDIVPVRDTVTSTITEEDEDEDELNLGLEELADALLEEDRRKAAAEVNIKADVHSSPLTTASAPREEHQPGPNGNDLLGPTKEQMQEDLKSKTRQLDHAQKLISEQQRIIAQNKLKGEDRDSGSEPSKQSFSTDLASAVEAKNKDEEEKEEKETSSTACAATFTPLSSSTHSGAPPAPPPPPPGPPPPPIAMTGGVRNIDCAKMTLKRVNWEKLSDVGLENTVWAQLGRNERLENVIELMELEQNFSTIHKSKEAKGKKDEKPSVLHSKKIYNISILLAHLKMSTEEIKSAILAMDHCTLNEAHIKQLLMYAPDSTELQKYKYLAEDLGKMEKADQFSYQMSKIPYYTQRLKALLFRLQFDDKVDEIKPDLEAVIEASKELRSCDKLQKLLELVLVMGNYMNKGNVRIAEAQGFKINYLTKLTSTKTTDSKSTLLNFLVHKIEDMCPDVLVMKDNLRTVPVAAKVSGQMVASEIQDLSRRMKAIQDDLISFQATNIQSVDDHFTDVVIDIIEETEGKLEELLDLQKTMNTEFKQTVTFFGETLAKTTTEEFFAVFATFLVHFEAAIAQNINKKKLKDEQTRREQRSKLFKELKQRSQSITDNHNLAKDELTKSLDQQKVKFGKFEEESQSQEQIKQEAVTETFEVSLSSRVFACTQEEKSETPFIISKPLTPLKAAVPSKSTSPTTAISMVKPMLITKPTSKEAVPTKTLPPPLKPKFFKKDSNNNACKIKSSTEISQSDSENDSMSLSLVEMNRKKEKVKQIPQGFKNIVSAFEMSTTNEDALYAKPDKKKKYVHSSSKEPPDVPPKLFDKSPTKEGFDVQKLSQNKSTLSTSWSTLSQGDEASVNQELSPPTNSVHTLLSVGCQSSTILASKDSTIMETPGSIYIDKASSKFKRQPCKESMHTHSSKEINILMTTDSERNQSSSPPYIDQGPPSFKPPPPPVDHVNDPLSVGEVPSTLVLHSSDNILQQRGISPPPDFKTVSHTTNVRDSTVKGDFNEAHCSIDVKRDTYVEMDKMSLSDEVEKVYKSDRRHLSGNSADSYSFVKEVSSIQLNPAQKYPKYEEVILRDPQSYAFTIGKEQKPPKPLSYKGSAQPPKPPPYTHQIPPPLEYSADSNMVVDSPTIPVVGSSGLHTANLASNLRMESSQSLLSDNCTWNPRGTSRPPLPPRSSSIKVSSNSDIDDLITKALSPEMRPECDLHPERDIGPSTVTAPPPAFRPESVPTLELSAVERPPSPAIDTSLYVSSSLSSVNLKHPRLNGYNENWGEDNKLELAPPLSPSNKYELDGRLKAFENLTD